MTLALNSSVESQEPIFNNAAKAGAAAEPNSSAEANKGTNCRDKKIVGIKNIDYTFQVDISH
jgi:hypothetical protein